MECRNGREGRRSPEAASYLYSDGYMPENHSEGIQASLGPESPNIQYLKALVKSDPVLLVLFIPGRQGLGVKGRGEGRRREVILPNSIHVTLNQRLKHSSIHRQYM